MSIRDLSATSIFNCKSTHIFANCKVKVTKSVPFLHFLAVVG